MALLHVALEEGFEGDGVVVRVDGEEVFRQDEVTTRTQIGLATSFETEVATASVQLRIEVASRNLSKEMPVPVEQGVYVGVSIEGDDINCRISSEPFGYL